MADYNSAYTGAEIDQGVGNGLAAPTTYAPKAHDDANTTYGKGTDTKYGHLKLSASTSSTSGTSGGIAATPSAVKAAYDLANGKQSPATTLAGYGITDAASSADLGTFVRPNLLDNWYFVGGGSQQGGGHFPINQRGETSYSGTVYMIDRWVGLGAQTRSDLTSEGIKLYRASTSDTGRITQRLDTGILSSLEGKTVTISALFDTVPSSTGALLMMWNNTNIGQVEIGASSPKLVSKTITVPTSGYSTSDASHQRVQCSTNALSAGAGVLKAMKLELGSTQTLAHQENGTWVLNEIPNFEVELAKCQMHQTFLFGASNYGRIGIGVADTATAIHVNIPIPTSMRIDAPALTFLAGSISDIFLWDAAANTYASITAWNVTSSRSSGWLELNIVSSDLTAGKTYILRTKTNTVQVLADANL